MRTSIILTLCFLGVVSAGSLNKRSFFDDIQNKTQEGLKALQDFKSDIDEKVQTALIEAFFRGLSGKSKRDIFGDLQSFANAGRERAEKAFESFQSGNALGELQKFADGQRQKAEEALKGLQDGSVFQELKKLAENGREKAQEALKNLQDGHLLQELQKLADGGRKQAEEAIKNFQDGKVVENLQKFAEEGRNKIEEAIKNFQSGDIVANLQKLAEDGRKQAEEALKKLQNGELLADLQKLADSGRHQAEEAVKNIQDLINRFQQPQEDSTEKTVAKRATNPLVLINDLGDPAKFAQDLIKVLADMALQGRRKRDVMEDLKKFADAGRQKAEEALKNIFDLFNSFRNGAKPEETATEVSISKRDVSEDLQKIAEAGKERAEQALKNLFEMFEHLKDQFQHKNETETITKRDVSESLNRFGQVAQEKAQEAFNHLREAFANLFKGVPAFNKPAEDTTEVSVSKRDVFEQFEQFNDQVKQQAEKAFGNFRQAFENFFNSHRGSAKPVQEEPVTVSSA